MQSANRCSPAATLLALFSALLVVVASQTARCRDPKKLVPWKSLGRWTYLDPQYRDSMPGTVIYDMASEGSELFIRSQNLSKRIETKLPKFWKMDTCARAGFGITSQVKGKYEMFSFMCDEGHGYDLLADSCCDIVKGKKCSMSGEIFFSPVHLKCNYDIPEKKGGYNSMGEENGFFNKFPGWNQLDTDDERPAESFLTYYKQSMHRYCKVGPFKLNDCLGSEPFKRTMNYIITSNGEKFYLENLNLRSIQMTDKEECFSCEGESCVDTTCSSGLCRGDSIYTSIHGGLSSAECKCIYNRRCEKTVLSYPRGEMDIDCWGSENVKIYLKAEEESALRESVRCDNCIFKCSKIGIELTTRGQEFTHYTVCGNPGCVTGEFEKADFEKGHTTIEMPHTMRVVSHHVFVKLWTTDGRIYERRLSCDALNVCDNINCMLCYNSFVNFQCWSGVIWTIIVAVSITAMVSIVYCWRFLTIVGEIGYWLCRPFYLIGKAACVKSCRKIKKSKKVYERFVDMDDEERDLGLDDINAKYVKDSETIEIPLLSEVYNETTIPNQKKKKGGFSSLFRNSKGGLSFTKLSVLFIIIPVIDCCSKVTSLTSTINNCVVSVTGEETCTINSNTRLVMAPLGQDSCLIIKGSDDKTIANLFITVNEVKILCKKSSLYFTITTDSECSSHYNCRSVGDCYGDLCEGVKKKGKLSYWTELYQHPYNSYCRRSGGCAGNGCGLCAPGCLFYAEALKPKENRFSYEVFECPQWTYELDVTIRYVTLGNSDVKIVKLYPGVMDNAFDIDVSLVSISTPPQPILGKCVLYNSLGTFLSECNRRGEYSPGKVGEVQCPTKLDADKLTNRCLMAEGLLQTNPGVTQVSCTSTIVDIENTLQKSKFPLKLEEVLLYEEDGEIKANFHGNSLFEIQMDIKDKKISTKSELNYCFARFINISGCYNCLSGAELYMEINTNFGSAVGQITCPEISVNIPFSANTNVIVKHVNVHINTPTINDECFVKCPAGEKKMKIVGTLNYVENKDTRTTKQIVTTSGEGNDSIKFSFGGLGWLGSYKTILTSLFFTFVFLIGSFFVFKMIMRIKKTDKSN